jgi:hypothetical protein
MAFENRFGLASQIFTSGVFSVCRWKYAVVQQQQQHKVAFFAQRLLIVSAGL